jgi:hypothetical protein
MNKHILFVIDHLANTGKYTQEELDANKESASAVFSAYADATAYSAYSASYDAYYADNAYYADDSADASYWVDEYFKITGEDKQTYIDALGE